MEDSGKSLLQKQRQSTEQYYIIYHSLRPYTIYSARNVVLCVFAKGSNILVYSMKANTIYPTTSVVWYISLSRNCSSVILMSIP